MLRLTGNGSWPREWEPLRWSTFDQEPFADWWLRCGHYFPHLDARVLEQWVYRHWELSPYWGFPLLQCRSSLEIFTTEVLLSDVGFIDFPDQIDLDFIYRA